MMPTVPIQPIKDNNITTILQESRAKQALEILFPAISKRAQDIDLVTTFKNERDAADFLISEIYLQWCDAFLEDRRINFDILNFPEKLMEYRVSIAGRGRDDAISIGKPPNPVGIMPRKRSFLQRLLHPFGGGKDGQ